jgi:hypothetical protein
MKTLKITLMLLAVLMLTVSGQNSDTLKQDSTNSYDPAKTTTYDLLAHSRKGVELPPNG